jgi:hypothetical protein
VVSHQRQELTQLQVVSHCDQSLQQLALVGRQVLLLVTQSALLAVLPYLLLHLFRAAHFAVGAFPEFYVGQQLGVLAVSVGFEGVAEGLEVGFGSGPAVPAVL